jgi:hypothetical protein
MSLTPGDRITLGLGIGAQVVWPFASATIAYVVADAWWSRGLVLVSVWALGGVLLWFVLQPVFALLGSVFDGKR